VDDGPRTHFWGLGESRDAVIEIDSIDEGKEFPIIDLSGVGTIKVLADGLI